MDWVLGLFILAIGVLIGFFAQRFFQADTQSTLDNSESEQTIQELMKQQAVMHIQESKQISENLLNQAASLKKQIGAYEQSMMNQNAGLDDNSIRYFGENATTYLRNKDPKATREKSSSDVQPLDFSSQSSGLFTGTEETTLKESK